MGQTQPTDPGSRHPRPSRTPPPPPADAAASPRRRRRRKAPRPRSREGPRTPRSHGCCGGRTGEGAGPAERPPPPPSSAAPPGAAPRPQPADLHLDQLALARPDRARRQQRRRAGPHPQRHQGRPPEHPPAWDATPLGASDREDRTSCARGRQGRVPRRSSPRQPGPTPLQPPPRALRPLPRLRHPQPASRRYKERESLRCGN